MKHGEWVRMYGCGYMTKPEAEDVAACTADGETDSANVVREEQAKGSKQHVLVRMLTPPW